MKIKPSEFLKKQDKLGEGMDRMYWFSYVILILALVGTITIAYITKNAKYCIYYFFGMVGLDLLLTRRKKYE